MTGAGPHKHHRRIAFRPFNPPCELRVTREKGRQIALQGTGNAHGAWTGAADGAVSGVTASDGTVTLSTGEMNGGSDVTFTVTDVEHSSLPYDPTLNHDPDADSDGTTITVSKP